MDEFHLHNFECSTLYKKNITLYHDQKFECRKFHQGDLFLLYNSRHCLFLGKPRFKFFGPFTVMQVFLHGAIELKINKGTPFKVNGQCVKHYVGTI